MIAVARALPRASVALALLIAWSLALLSASVQAQPLTHPGPGWVELFEEDGIYVWEKPIPGRDLPRYRAAGVLNANMYGLLAVLNDFERHHEWMRFMSETRIIERPNDFNLTIYVRFDAPWPVSDRDVVMRVTVDLDRQAEEVVMRFERVERPDLPPQEDVVRVSRGTMVARLRYLGPRHTEVDCAMDIDPAGSLPRWLVRWFSKRIPYQALQRLKEQIEQTQGQYVSFRRKYDPRLQP